MHAVAGPPDAHDPEATERHVRRVRRLKVKLAAWIAGTAIVVGLWILLEWRANGAFERFSTGGDPGDWNPTLPALIVGIWGLTVGIAALRVRFESSRLRFHIAAWVLGMVVIAPLNALIEWQDNGSFERWSDDSQPGSWEPWVLYIGGVWALVIVIGAVWEYAARRRRAGDDAGGRPA